MYVKVINWKNEIDVIVGCIFKEVVYIKKILLSYIFMCVLNIEKCFLIYKVFLKYYR